MSDMSPPPGYSSPPPPPPGYGNPPPGQGWNTSPPPGQGWSTGSPPPSFDKPPRANVAIGGVLLIVGGAIAALGAFLPWASGSGFSVNGFDELAFRSGDTIETVEGAGVVALIGGLIGIGLGIALVAAGRVLAVAIIAMVMAPIGVLFGIGFVAIANDTADLVGGDLGIGAILQPIGPLVATAGAIICLAKRR